MKIRVKTIQGHNVDFDVDPQNPLSTLREAITNRLDIPNDRIRLIYMGKVLQNPDQSIESYGVEEDTVIHMVSRPPNLEPIPLTQEEMRRDERLDRTNDEQLLHQLLHQHGFPQQTPATHVLERVTMLRSGLFLDRARVERIIRQALTTPGLNIPSDIRSGLVIEWRDSSLSVRFPPSEVMNYASPALERMQHIERYIRNIEHFIASTEVSGGLAAMVDQILDQTAMGFRDDNLRQIASQAAERLETPPRSPPLRRGAGVNRDAVTHSIFERNARFESVTLLLPEPRGGPRTHVVRHELGRDLSSLLDNLHQTYLNMRPHVQQYQRILESGLNFSDLRRNSLSSDPISGATSVIAVYAEHVQRAMHWMSHAFHIASDLHIRLEDPIPRRLHPQAPQRFHSTPGIGAELMIELVDPASERSQRILTMEPVTHILEPPTSQTDIAHFPNDAPILSTLYPTAMSNERVAGVITISSTVVNAGGEQATPIDEDEDPDLRRLIDLVSTQQRQQQQHAVQRHIAPLPPRPPLSTIHRHRLPNHHQHPTPSPSAPPHPHHPARPSSQPNPHFFSPPAVVLRGVGLAGVRRPANSSHSNLSSPTHSSFRQEPRGDQERLVRLLANSILQSNISGFDNPIPAGGNVFEELFAGLLDDVLVATIGNGADRSTVEQRILASIQDPHALRASLGNSLRRGLRIDNPEPAQRPPPQPPATGSIGNENAFSIPPNAASYPGSAGANALSNLGSRLAQQIFSQQISNMSTAPASAYVMVPPLGYQHPPSQPQEQRPASSTSLPPLSFAPIGFVQNPPSNTTTTSANNSAASSNQGNQGPIHSAFGPGSLAGSRATSDQVAVAMEMAVLTAHQPSFAIRRPEQAGQNLMGRLSHLDVMRMQARRNVNNADADSTAATSSSPAEEATDENSQDASASGSDSLIVIDVNDGSPRGRNDAQLYSPMQVYEPALPRNSEVTVPVDPFLICQSSHGHQNPNVPTDRQPGFEREPLYRHVQRSFRQNRNNSADEEIDPIQMPLNSDRQIVLTDSNEDEARLERFIGYAARSLISSMLDRDADRTAQSNYHTAAVRNELRAASLRTNLTPFYAPTTAPQPTLREQLPVNFNVVADVPDMYGRYPNPFTTNWDPRELHQYLPEDERREAEEQLRMVTEQQQRQGQRAAQIERMRTERQLARSGDNTMEDEDDDMTRPSSAHGSHALARPPPVDEETVTAVRTRLYGADARSASENSAGSTASPRPKKRRPNDEEKEGNRGDAMGESSSSSTEGEQGIRWSSIVSRDVRRQQSSSSLQSRPLSTGYQMGLPAQVRETSAESQQSSSSSESQSSSVSNPTSIGVVADNLDHLQLLGAASAAGNPATGPSSSIADDDNLD